MRRGPEPVAGAMSKPPSPSGTTSISPASEFSSVPVTPSTVTSVPGVRSSKVRALESSFVVWWMFVAAPTLAYRMPLGVAISRVWSSARTDRILPVRPYLLTNPQLACSAKLPHQFRDLVLVHPLATSHALLQVAAGPDAAEEGHPAMLRFIRTRRNTKMTPAGVWNKRFFCGAKAGGGWSEVR